MDCSDARLFLTLERREPGQLDAVEVEALERHVELCPACQTWNRSEARFDTAMASAMKNVTTPAGLKSSILARLTPERPAARSRPWMRPVAWAAIAAGVLLLVGAGYFAWSRPVAVTMDGILEQIEHKGSSPEAVEEYFAARGYRITAPRQFRYECLVKYEEVMFQGRLVPQLIFQAGGGRTTAYVKCLSDRQFRVDQEGIERVHGHTVSILTDEGTIYVIDCIGDLGQLRQDVF